jgi:deazaflavin-dependent oxidoreductase (nitroreductase family)
MSDWNTAIVDEFRANGGRVGGHFEGASMLLLHTVGAKTGKKRVNPLLYRRDGDCFVLFATKAGAPTDPDWFRNLQANPDVEAEIGEARVTLRARTAEGVERDRLWAVQKEETPAFADYELHTTRRIPVVILEPR